ncbi:MAG: selenocysteine-specific translation elongation factor [Aquificota bacterium]|nr:selenocysteine-specific translation elongation factor [Aquificota bacterium]
MRYVLFATAGHVDHGKTTLIKKLTGIDTDRLPEEKRRGLSIDMGFAYIDYPESNLRLELIDVPGHERFIKNAIAGLSSVSGVLLVVDAGEGVMPQTREHMEVAKSLGVKYGVAVLTKIDKTPSELLPVAEEELREFLRGEGLEFPILKVSALTGEGIGELRKVLREQAQSSLGGKRDMPLRIFIDSAFTVKGHGTILRGSCVEGQMREGERVVVEPIGRRARVRRVQNHGVFVREAEAGERVALNLPEVEAGEVERGFWVLKPDTYVKGRSLIISSESELRSGRVYHAFFGMREVKGRFSSIGEGLYILRLEEEVVVRRGDRFVILDSTGRLAGGGEVLHPSVRVKKKGFIRDKVELLRDNFEAYLLREMGTEGLSGELFRRMTGRAPNTGRLEGISVKVGSRFYSLEVMELLREKLRSMVEKRLDEGSFGILKAEALEKLGAER